MGRPITVVVGGLATADPDGAGTTQKAAGAQYLALNGALTDGQTANNVAQSQTPGAAGNLTLNGTLVSGGVAYLGQNSRVYFTCAGNESGVTFTITGLAQNAGGLYSVTETLTGPNASIIASQKLYYSISSIAISGAAANTITVGRAGTATFDKARRVVIVSGGNDTGITFTVVGTDIDGAAQTEAITGVSGSTATGVLSFKTVTSILTSGAVATTVTMGSSAVADSHWVRFDDYGAHAEVAIQVTVSGTINFTVQQTLDDPNDVASALYKNPAGVTWVNHPDSALAGATATAQGNYAYPPLFAKIVANSGTGTATMTVRQVFLGH